MSTLGPPSAAPPRISVVVPTHDRAELLERALASVLAQTLADFELVVVDDGSSDGTQALLAGLAEPRLRVLRQEHRGVGAARNLGIGTASAPLVTFLDSDDEALPTWLERLVSALADPAVGIVCCGHFVQPVAGARERVDPAPQGAIFAGQPGPYLAGTFAVRRELLAAAGGYDELLSFSENTELAMRLIPVCLERGFSTRALAEPLVVIHTTRSQTPNRAWLERCLASSERVLERHAALLARDGKVHALLLATAGVRAARLGRFAEARRYFGEAVRADPRSLRHRARCWLAGRPALGARVWREVRA